MSRNRTITDPAFDRVVTLRDAYRVMERFITAFHERGAMETGALLGYFGIAPDGIGGDPAALDDYLAAAGVELGPAPAPGGQDG